MRKIYNFLVFLDRTWQNSKVEKDKNGEIVGLKCRTTPPWLAKLADYFRNLANK